MRLRSAQFCHAFAHDKSRQTQSPLRDSWAGARKRLNVVGANDRAMRVQLSIAQLIDAGATFCLIVSDCGRAALSRAG
jgi:hypothetical protein